MAEGEQRSAKKPGIAKNLFQNKISEFAKKACKNAKIQKFSPKSDLKTMA